MFKKNYDVVALVLISSLVVLLALFNNPVSADATYYLAISRDISTGLIPYLDVKSAYTPLMMYANSWIFKLSPDFHYQYFQFFQYFILLLSALVLNNILQKRIQVEKSQSLLISLLFFVSIFCSDGYYIVLEPYVIFFTLLAIYYILKPNKKATDFFVAGSFISFSFLAKQYGALNILPFGYLLLTGVIKKEYRVSGIIYFCIGAIAVLAVILAYFIHAGITVPGLLDQLLGDAQDYAEDGVKGSKSIFSYFIGGKIFFIIFLPLIIVIARNTSLLKQRIFIFSLIGIGAFLISTGIKSFQHYFISIFPFLFLLIGLLVKSGLESHRKYWKISFYLFFFLFQVMTVSRILKFSDRKADQKIMAKNALDQFPKHSRLFIVGGDRFFYLVNNYFNSASAVIGYSYNLSDAQKYITDSCDAPIIFSKQSEINELKMDQFNCRYSLIDHPSKSK